MPSTERPHWRDRLAAIGESIETALLSVLLLSMIGLASLQIVLRNWFSTGLPWADDLVRLCVLWLAVVGAVAACRDDRHIAINIVARYGPKSWQRPAALIASAFATVVTALISWQSVRFVADSYRFGDTVLGDQPAWIYQLVLPIGFALMSYRFLLRFVKQLRT
ncbi:MAG: TRAP transporter small permease [Gammaproteobacteria bacterium]